MKTLLVLPLLAGSLLGAGGGTTEAQKKDLAKFTGTWEVGELIYNGEDHTKLKFKVTFKGNEGIIEGNDRVKREYARIRFKIDPAAKPRIMDIQVAAGSQTDAAMEGIYEFQGDDLRICAKVFGKDRPDTFAAPEGSSCVLMVLKRAAP